MANERQYPPVTDPDNVPEIFCDGQFHVAVAGGLATLTFTHVRPDATTMFGDDTEDLRAVVRARLVVTHGNLVALRDVLNQIIQSPETPAPPAGGPTRH